MASAQSTLDDFLKNVCHRCGRSFTSQKGLKTHLAWHRNADLDTVRTTFWKFINEMDTIKTEDIKTFFNAVINACDDPQKAITILSKSEVFRDLVEAISNTAADAWMEYASMVLTQLAQSGGLEVIRSLINGSKSSYIG